MQRPRFVPFFASVVLGFSVNAHSDAKWAINAGAGLVDVETSEVNKVGAELNAESGQLISRFLGAELATASGYFWGGSIYNADGDIDYKGVSNTGTAIPNGSTYLYIWRNDVYFGKELKDVTFTPRLWIDLGGQLKERHISTNNNVQGYNEDYTWWSAALGAEVKLLNERNYSWTLAAVYTSMIEPKNKPSNLNFELALGTTASQNLHTRFTYLLGAGFYLDGLLGITKTDMARSRNQYQGSSTSPIAQPKSSWDDTELQLGISKRF